MRHEGPAHIKTAVLVQVMAAPGFDGEIAAKPPNVPQRSFSDIANRCGCWGFTAGFNERDDGGYSLRLRKFMLDDATAFMDLVLKRFGEF